MAAAHRFDRVLGPRSATSRLRDEEARPALERADKVILRGAAGPTDQDLKRTAARRRRHPLIE
jgi:molybdopterin-biosynthesis enzyme MoeA-like protein